MSNVLPFRRPLRVVSAPAKRQRVTGFGLTLQTEPNAVLLVAHNIELGLSPAQARELGRELIECADDAEVPRG